MGRSQRLSRFLILPCLAVLVLGIPACHRGEHPEHPEDEQPVSIDAVAAFLEDYVATESSMEDGLFTVHDEATDTDLELTLDRVHRERLAKTGEGTYFVCADFTTADGKLYDLDFWVQGAEGSFAVTEIMIHKEDGKARYSWAEEGGVWKRQPI